jgi:nitroimidazol reductase NimA-like FMN-containing flavoprotein (pyridoxamine 5'-phosphate oxidase superfamily)
MGESPARGVSWQQLTRSECFDLLAGESLGRLAFVDARGPIVLPVNFVLDRHMVIIRTDEGAKLDMAGRGGRVAFEVDRADAATRTGWSVLIRGEAIEVTDPYELARLRELPLQTLAPGAKGHYVRILPATLSGRRIAAPDRESGGRGPQPPRGGAPDL